ncbi:hypothetical protein H9P43_001532 [Blastocladiella emersonii ATCC 22665]|nr:hypothetical protein H9P43_001532 [Blastocladiella emersonii ATCC 22665]
MQSDRRPSPSKAKPTAASSPTKAPPSPSRDAAAAPPPPETVVYGESEFTGGDIAGKYGLLVKGTKRRRGGDATAATESGAAATKDGDSEEPYEISTAPRDAPLLTKGRGELEEAIQDLPEHCSMEDYEAKPIADFGVAMLRSMGWSEGQAIGRNQKNGLVKPIQYIPRPSLLGLGAQPTPDYVPTASGKRRRADAPAYELPTDANGKVRHYVTVDEKLEARRVLAVGGYILVTHGRHAGMLGVVRELMHHKELARVELAANGDLVKVDARDLKLLSPAEYDAEAAKREAKAKQHPAASSSSSTSILSPGDIWVRPNLRVRIVSKSLAGGKYYERKARIVDVLPGGVSVVEVEDSRRSLLEGVPQKALETTVPSIDGLVRVVRVPRKLRGDRDDLLGVRGQIIDKDKKREEVVVRVEDDEVVVCGFDDVCAIA